MEAHRRRRKACDLCYRRKLKCNGDEPRCSNCVAYQADCTHQAESRKWQPKSQAKADKRKDSPDKDAENIDSLHFKILQLETKLAQTPPPPADIGSNESGYSLPPLRQVLPMVEAYINQINSFLPLFHAGTLLRLVGDCYSHTPRQRDPVAWAAINVVLAIVGQQISDLDNGLSGLWNDYLRNAQSVLSSIMLGESRLLNIQVLVGMSMVAQSAHDPTQALILISSAFRLIHKMGLHSRISTMHLELEERRHHANVFWLAYTLDKELSLRGRQAPVQRDDDIDLDLPHGSLAVGDEDEGTPGVISTPDGSSRINYLLARVQLANIEGGIYDYLWSTRASTHSLDERFAVSDSVMRALDEWKAGIPPAFCPTAVAEHFEKDPTSLGFFCILHSISLMCNAVVMGAHSCNDQWMDSVRDLGGRTRVLQLPLGWPPLVDQARESMKLMGPLWSEGIWFRWVITCPYVTSMVILMANNLQYTWHEHKQADSEMLAASVQWLTAVAPEQKSNVRLLQETCAEIFHEVERKRIQL